MTPFFTRRLSKQTSLQSPLQLKSFKDKHKDEIIIVCGCGESLSSLVNSQDYITIGVNDAGRVIHPTYLVVLNPETQFGKNRYQYVDNSDAEAIFSQLTLNPKKSQTVKIALGCYGGTDCFSNDKLDYTQNSPYLAVCLAAYMGAKTIGLIGVDFTDNSIYAENTAHTLKGNLASINEEYSALRNTLSNAGVELVNLSKNSRLVSLPKKSLNELMPAPSIKAERTTSETVAESPDWERPYNQLTTQNKQALKIVHIAKTNCAGALWNLHNLINAHTSHKSRVITASRITNGRTYPQDVCLSDTEAVKELILWADIIHFHNWIDKFSPEMHLFRHLLKNKPAVLQYHSGPDVLQKQFPGRCIITRKDITTLVIAQKQARFYPNAKIVPNAIDISTYQLRARPAIKRINSRRITVLYTPTDKKDYSIYETTCSGKGYTETVRILKKLHNKGIIHAEIHSGVSFDTIMKLRNEADVVIDECVTGGYHLTSLESLSQGLATIAYLDPETETLLSSITQSTIEDLPWVNTHLNQLENRLIELALDRSLLSTIKRKSRKWMETHWTAKKVVTAYCDIYSAEFTDSIISHIAQTPDKISKKGKLIHYRINGKTNPVCSEDFEQTVLISKSLIALKSVYKGKSCHILGNGPSVTEFELSQLQNRIVITVNASAVLDTKLGRASDFYCVSDRRFLENEKTKSIALSSKATEKIFAAYCHGYLEDAHINYARINGGYGISNDIQKGFYHNCSVALFAAQIALWLGCTDIYLHGCEFDYSRGRFSQQHKLPHDQETYPRVEKGAQLLANVLTKLGGSLNVVGQSKLVGDFGCRPIANINKVSYGELSHEIENENQHDLPQSQKQNLNQHLSLNYN